MDIQNQLFNAIHENNQNLVRKLVGLGANIEAVNHTYRNTFGNTPLTYAVMKNRPQMVRLLVELGANIEAGDNRNNTALMLAVMKNRLKIVRLLVELGANIDATDNDGNIAAIMSAADYVYLEMVRLLVELGINIEIRNKWGLTIIDELRKGRNNQPMINIIEKGVRTREEDKKMAFYLSMLKRSEGLPHDKNAPLSGVYKALLNANPYLVRDIAGYVFREEEKGAEESKSGDAGGRRKSFRRKKSGSRRRKSTRRKKSGSRRKSNRRKKSN